MSKMDVLQWLGFIAVVFGIVLYDEKPIRAIMWSFIGCTILAAWCLLSDPIPWGVFAVQLVAGGAWLNNYSRACKRLHGRLCDD